MDIQRLQRPPGGQAIDGWCLYEDDQWDGPGPMESDESGWVVYREKMSTYVALAREMRNRCDLFAAGLCAGEHLRCNWYPVRVSLFPDGRIRDEFNSEHFPMVF